MVKQMEFNPDFDNIVVEAILPQMHAISDSIDEHIQREAPVETGALKEASKSVVDDTNGNIEVGVVAGVVNPRTHQLVENYAKYVVEGTSQQSPNFYLELAVEAALQEQRAR